MTKELSSYWSDDKSRKSVISIDLKEEVYSIDFYENETIVKSMQYPNNSIHYVEDAADNWVRRILNF